MENPICHDVVSVDKKGIILKCENGNIFVDFKECAKNAALQYSYKTCKCVAERDITKLKFIFYTCPKTTLVFQKHFFKDLFAKKSALQKFNDLRNAIFQFGYTSYDLS